MEALSELGQYLYQLVENPGDINEHLFTLCDYAKRSESICELGVRSGISTAAFALGLARNHRQTKLLHCVDIEDCGNTKSLTLAKASGIDAVFVQGDSAKIQIPEVDLLFIDSWHCYGHLKRELAKHHGQVKKWIVLHDTVVYGRFGESVRWQSDLIEQSAATGYSIDEIYKGLMFAVEEFLASHSQWEIELFHEHNHGLTVLKRKSHPVSSESSHH